MRARLTGTAIAHCVVLAVVVACAGVSAPTVPSPSQAATGGEPSPESAGAGARGWPRRPKEPINFAIPGRGLNYIGPVVAASLGFFDEAGVEVTLMPLAANLTVAALQRGDLQLSAAGGSATRAAVRGGAAFKIVSFMTAHPTYYLITRPDVRTPAQLAGRRIGVNTVGDSLTHFLELYARQRGVEPGQLAVIGMGPDNVARVVAMHAGALDGAVVDPGAAAMAEVQGLHLLDALGDVAPQPLQSVVATEEYFQTKPTAIRGFLKGLVRGLLYVKQQPRETAALARQELELDLDEGTALRAVQLFADAIWGEAPGYADERLMEAFYHYDIRLPLELPPEHPIPVLHDFRYLLEAYVELGIPRPR